jgi:hypothetical protein
MSLKFLGNQRHGGCKRFRRAGSLSPAIKEAPNGTEQRGSWRIAWTRIPGRKLVARTVLEGRLAQRARLLDGRLVPWPVVARRHLAGELAG